MLNRRDRELAREIARHTRHPPTNETYIGIPGISVIISYITCVPLTVYLYVTHHWIFSLPTGFVLFFTPVMHAATRSISKTNKKVNIIYLILYIISFSSIYQILLKDGHEILSNISIFFGALTAIFLLKAIFLMPKLL